MLESFYNSIYLKLWSGDKKIGPKKNVLVSKSCEIFGDTVYDIRWTLKYIHKNGKTSHSVTISERSNKWNLIKTIQRVEKQVLPKEADALISNNTHSD